jgi:hypothetical protein
MTEKQTVWMVKSNGGEPQEVEAIPEKLIPMMVAGWSQCGPPENQQEESI